jgi:hypothetical protein
MVTNNFGNKSFMQSMIRLSTHPLWGGGARRDLFAFALFPIFSHGVPHDVPNSTSDLSHMVCPKFNSHVYKLKRWVIEGAQSLLFVLRLGSKEVLPLGSAQCSEKFDDGPIHMAPLKKKYNMWAHPWTNYMSQLNLLMNFELRYYISSLHSSSNIGIWKNVGKIVKL